jgi:hypothetical protein
MVAQHGSLPSFTPCTFILVRTKDLHTLSTEYLTRPASKQARRRHRDVAYDVTIPPCFYLLRLITRSCNPTFIHLLRLRVFVQPTSTSRLTLLLGLPTRWRRQRNTKTFHNATASKEQATANRLPHTRPNLYPETSGLRMTMCPTISRYTYKALLRHATVG